MGRRRCLVRLKAALTPIKNCTGENQRSQMGPSGRSALRPRRTVAAVTIATMDTRVGLRGGATPLAVRMRPTSLDEVAGQRHLLGPGSPLVSLATDKSGEQGSVSVILWGPPGTGKTTLAQAVAHSSGRNFVELSAVNAGVADVRKVMEQALSQRDLYGVTTVLFLDEIHRFSKAQQDALLPGVENGWIILIAGHDRESVVLGDLAAALAVAAAHARAAERRRPRDPHRPRGRRFARPRRHRHAHPAGSGGPDQTVLRGRAPRAHGARGGRVLGHGIRPIPTRRMRRSP